MLKEYLEELKSSNQEEILRLEKELNQLVQDLECGQEWIDKLHKEQNIDASIFSPRSQNAEKQRNMESARKNIEEIKQKVEYTREKIEELIKKKNEYENLLMEAEHSCSSQDDTSKKEKEDSYDPYDVQIPLSSFLEALHRKTDICLALLNGDKNKCRNELRRMKKEIKEYEEQIEKNKK